MKKKLKDEVKWYFSATLYRPDLEEIIHIFKEACPDLIIADDDWEYDSIEELESKRGQVIKKLAITSDTPQLSLTIDREKTELKRGGSVSILSQYTQIRQILKAKRRPILFGILNPISAILIAAVIFAAIGRWGKNWPQGIVFAVAPPIAILFGGMLKNMSGAFSKILLIHSHERQSFMSRNKDSIIVGLISTFIGAALSFLVAYLLFRGGVG